MASIIKSDNGVSSGITGIVQSADSSGQLVLQTTTSGGTATTAVTIDNSQNVGVGVTPSAWTLLKPIEIGALGTYISGRPGSNQLDLGVNNYYSSGYKYAVAGQRATQYEQFNGNHSWYYAGISTNAGDPVTFTQAMTLDANNNLLIGQTTRGVVNSNSFNLDVASSTLYVNHANGVATGSAYLQFGYNASVIGSITQNGTTGVLYNLTSDYRLKNNPEALTGAKDFIMALKPKKWQWWDGSGEGVGFVAHEFMEVAKYSGHGEKDAVDADGKPVYQSIQPSSSEVMANLVSFIQELSAQVTSLQATVETQATTIATLQNKIGA